MKKILSIFVVLALVFSMFSVLTLQAEKPAEPEVDENTQVIKTYEGEVSPGVWLNKFDSDDECIGEDYVIFNTAAPLKAIRFCSLYCGKSENDQEAECKFELYKWDKDVETTRKSTPVYTHTDTYDGDQDWLVLSFDSAVPAGQYLFLVKPLSPRGSTEVGHYVVLGNSINIYTNLYLEYSNVGEFALDFYFEKTEGSTYLKLLEGADQKYAVDPAFVVAPRNGDNPQRIEDEIEFAILTPEIPDGKVLAKFIIANAPTWSNTNGDSDLVYEVYKWKGDYDTTYLSKPIYQGEILNHKDNSDMTLTFGTACRYGNRYLIVLIKSNDGTIGFWGGSEAKEGWEFFMGGEEAAVTISSKAAYGTVGDLGPEPTEEPTATPTEKPTDTPEPTEAPATDVPAATDAPKATEEAAATDAPSEKKSGCGGIISGFAVVAILGTVVVLRKKEK